MAEKGNPHIMVGSAAKIYDSRKIVNTPTLFGLIVSGEKCYRTHLV